jgi:two-component system, chemotaxis family, chemotaxis protein CheY
MQQGEGRVCALIIDDMDNVRQHLRQILSQLGGVDVLEANDGSSAGALFKQHKPELVFLDLQLPDINGQLLLKQFKAAPQQTQVFIVSAFSTVDNLKQALEHGASAFITKPVSAQRIRKLVQPLL